MQRALSKLISGGTEAVNALEALLTYRFSLDLNAGKSYFWLYDYRTS
jgi:hypothetical protein